MVKLIHLPTEKQKPYIMKSGTRRCVIVELFPEQQLEGVQENSQPQVEV